MRRKFTIVNVKLDERSGQQCKSTKRLYHYTTKYSEWIEILCEINHFLVDNSHLLVRTYDIIEWTRSSFSIELVWLIEVFFSSFTIELV